MPQPQQSCVAVSVYTATVCTHSHCGFTIVISEIIIAVRSDGVAYDRHLQVI